MIYSNMLGTLALLFAAVGAQASLYGGGKSILSSTTSKGHDALMSSVSKSDMKWLVFPKQKMLHLGESVEGNDIVQDSSFWADHGAAFGLGTDTSMVLQREWSIAGTHISHQRYAQFVHGVRVFGGEFQVAKGRHGGVLHAHGLPMKTDDIPKKAILSLGLSNDVSDVLAAVSGYFKARDNINVKVTPLGAVEKVWHMSQMGAGKQGVISLAYYVNGVTESGSFMAFDAFVEVGSLDVLHVIVKTSQVEPSPFSSPIDDADIFVYDQYLKDYNDDKNDNYYYQDPDRYSNATLVFDTTSDNYTYPTNDQEMNYLIDNTLYVKYMYYSLSAGTYLTWNETNTDLNIEYNLSIANAYFDGYWGIHFGTGYITDDVVPHEWSHGYTQTGCGLIYEYESGAMNEAFSDIFGESIDILNHDTTDPDHLRTEWPTTCHMTLNNAYGIPPGNDYGTRWSMGENVTTNYTNGDGSIRDMYRPECFFHPSTTIADYYSCTTYADGGGVHKNSGVLNRLFAVLTDGGQYTNPADPEGPTLQVEGLGWTKALNLFWRAHQELTPTSQYLDLAMTLSSVCELNIGTTLYYPNLFNSTIYESTEVLTAADCDNVEVAITGSGMADTRDFCPNIDCDDTGYNCEWANCASSNAELFYEPYDYYMGYQAQGSLAAACGDTADSTYARVFDQKTFKLKKFSLSCIQFAYFMEGRTNVTIDVYIDTTGGAPDYASMELVHSFSAVTINAVGQLQVQTVSAEEEIPIKFGNSKETLVIVLTTPVMDEGFITGGGQENSNVIGTTGETYVGGKCREDFESFYDYANDHGMSVIAENQWYVRVHGTDKHSNGDDDDSLSTGAVVGISIAAGVVGLGLLAAVAHFVFGVGAAAKSGTMSEPIMDKI